MVNYENLVFYPSYNCFHLCTLLPAGRGSESSDNASERLMSIQSTRVMKVGYLVSFSISFILLVTCFVVTHVNVPILPLTFCSLIFVAVSITAYKKFTSFKVSNFGNQVHNALSSNAAEPRRNFFNSVLAGGEMLHRARALGEESYKMAKREFLRGAYGLMDNGMEPLTREVKSRYRSIENVIYCA